MFGYFNNIMKFLLSYFGRMVNVINRIYYFLLVCLIVYFLCFIDIVYCEGTELVLWSEPGTIGSMVNHKWTAIERAHWVIANVPPYLLGIVVGLILSDCHLRIPKRGVNAFL